MPRWYLTIADVDAMSERMLANWWHALPQPKTDAERDVSERLSIRCEGCGVVPEEKCALTAARRV